MRPRATLLFLTLPWLALAAAACQDTTDSLGSGDASHLHPLTKRTCPNVLHDVLGLSLQTVDNKISMVYQQLFRGDVSTQGIYVGPNQSAGGSSPTAASDEAYVYDVLHLQIRTEGMGLAMMIEVELAQAMVQTGGPTNYRSEFDNFWRFAKRHLQSTVPTEAGYFNSYCDSADGMTNTSCLDPYGLEQFVTALIFAHDLWGSTTTLDYQADALSLLHQIRFKQDDNGGIVGGVTNTFDGTTGLPYSFPDTGALAQTRPSIVMPGYYEIWYQATSDPMFDAVAKSGRTLWQLAAGKPANKATGLLPVRSTFDGDALTGWAIFNPESYRNQINMVIDQTWTGDMTSGPFVDKILAFFTSQGNYGTSYTIDGMTCTNPLHETSLVVSNAIAAAITGNMDRPQYLSAFWSLATPTNNGRYYTGLLQLLGLLILSGQFQII